MLVVVKKPHTKKPLIEMKGAIPAWIITGLKRDYGKSVDVKADDEYVNIRDTDWWKEMENNRKPGDSLRNYRLNRGFTLSMLAQKIEVTPQRVHDMEKGTRGISKEMAKKLAEIFQTNPARFI